MIQRKLWLLALLLLLTPVGIAAGHSSTTHVSPRVVMVGGGSAHSASFSVTAVIGQPATDAAASANYKVSGGFLFPLGQAANDKQLWLPMIR